MKINSINSGTNTGQVSSMDVQNRLVEVNVHSKPVSVEKSTDVKLKSQAESIKDQESVNEEILAKSITQANKALETHNRYIERAVHDVTHTVMYTLKDTVTDEVIMEFPPKKIQDMIAKMWELAGLFVDEKA